MATRRKITFDYDPYPDLSWLDQPEFKNENKDDHVTLDMTVFELTPADCDWRIVDTLGSIDCLKDCDDWTTGTFYRVTDLPEGYLRSLARNAGLPE